MIDIAGRYFVLKDFKLQQFNIVSFSPFFVQSGSDIFRLPWLPQI